MIEQFGTPCLEGGSDDTELIYYHTYYDLIDLLIIHDAMTRKKLIRISAKMAELGNIPSISIFPSDKQTLDLI